MSVAEMKKVIHDKVDTIENEAVLKQVLQDVDMLNERQFDTNKFFDKVVE